MNQLHNLVIRIHSKISLLNFSSICNNSDSTESSFTRFNCTLQGLTVLYKV